MRATRTRKGMHPAAAVVLLLISAGVAGKAVLGGWSGPALVADEPAIDANANEATEDVNGDPVADAQEPGLDLLAVYGSFERGGVVNQAFGVFVDAPAAAPVGETAPGVPVAEAGSWIGEEPPRLRLGVVLLSNASRRAVIDSRVVGIGDSVGSVRVLHIEPGQVVVAWQARRLTYRLDSDVAVEFRAEAARRQAKGGGTNGGDAAAQTISKKDQGK